MSDSFLRRCSLAFSGRSSLCLALLGGALAMAGCGGGLKYTVDDAAMDPIPASDRAGVFEARKEQDIAASEQRSADTLLENLERDFGVAKNEKEQARLEIEKAIAEQEGAKASRDENQANAAAHNKDVADTNMKVVESKLEWLEQKRDWLKQNKKAAEAHVEAAKAHVELEKAKVAQQRGIKPSSDFAVSDFESQWKSKNSDYESEKKDATSEEQDTKKKEERWHEQQTQLQKMKG